MAAVGHVFGRYVITHQDSEVWPEGAMAEERNRQSEEIAVLERLIEVEIEKLLGNPRVPDYVKRELLSQELHTLSFSDLSVVRGKDPEL